jgi:FtsH-binding integral membrane protein
MQIDHQKQKENKKYCNTLEINEYLFFLLLFLYILSIFFFNDQKKIREHLIFDSY